jgi:plasmid stabilization system protein ParE
VAKVGYAPGAAADLERLEEAAPGCRTIIYGAIAMLADHPRIGRVVDDETEVRELVISRGKTGYVALYRYDEVSEEVIVAAIRHQREAGFE